MIKVFLDTSFAIALSSITDQHHVRATELAIQLEANKTHAQTTHPRIRRSRRRTHRLSIDPEHRPGVIENMEKIAEIARLITEFPLPDAIKPAPIFNPADD